MSSPRDFVDWELAMGDHMVARLRRLRELADMDGHWGDESAEFADLIDAFRDPEPMRPSGWWQ